MSNSNNDDEIENIVDKKSVNTNDDTLGELISVENEDETNTDILQVLPDNLSSKQVKSLETHNFLQKISNKNKIVIISISILLIVFILGFVLYYISLQKESIKPVKLSNVTKAKEYIFNKKDINVNRLNKKLGLLTKYEIIEEYNNSTSNEDTKENFYKLNQKEKKEKKEKRIEKIKKQEVYRLETIIESAKEEARAELIAQQFKEKRKKEKGKRNSTQNKKTNIIKTKIDLLQYIVIKTNKKSIYNSYMARIKEVNTSITLCRDRNNLIEIFIGPFAKKQDRFLVLNKLNKQNISANDTKLTQKDFNLKCKY